MEHDIECRVYVNEYNNRVINQKESRLWIAWLYGVSKIIV